MSTSDTVQIFRISPLIRIALWSFYSTLTLPLPLLAFQQGHHVSGWITLVGMGLGAIALYGALSEQVRLTDEAIAIVYPGWVPRWFRRSWSLPWAEIQTIKARSTGQGGLVYYLIRNEQEAYLLPMRVAGFAQMTRTIQAKTELDLAMSKPLAQVWMYGLLLAASVFLGLADGWVVNLMIQGTIPA